MKKKGQLNNIKKRGSIKPLLIYMVFLALFVPGAVSVFGQHYNFKTFTMKEGIGESLVNAVFQDKKGFLWIGTYGGGVDRYDGTRFINYSTKKGLSDNSVFCIIEDRKGNLWIGTSCGLNKYNGQNFTTYTKKDGLGGNFVRKIVEDQKGNLWVITDSDGISRFDGIGFKNFSTHQGLVSNDVRSILEDSRGNFWLGTYIGVSKYDGITFTSDGDAVTRRLRGGFIGVILEDGKDNLWFGTMENGALCYDVNKQTFTTYTTREGLCNNNVYDIMEDSDGNLWFCTYGGVSKFNGDVFTNYTSKQGLKYNMVTCMIEDREGNFWFGSGLGLVRFRNENITYFNEKEGLKNNFVWSIWQDGDGIMWLATEAGIGRFDPKEAKITMAGEYYAKQYAYAFYEDGNGNLWFGTGTDIIKYDGRVYTNFSKKYRLGTLNLYCVLEDNQGNMWFGTERSGVKVWDGKQVRNFTKENGLPHHLISAMQEDGQGNIWVATKKGLSRYDGDKFTDVIIDQDLNTISIMSMAKDQEGNLWIGTFGKGIIMCSPYQINRDYALETFTRITTTDGLMNDEILSMIFDDKGNLWIASKRGISVLDIAGLKKTGKYKWKYYTKDDGFNGIEPSDNAVYKDIVGNIWFGTLNGAIKFNPNEDKPNTLEPTSYITGLKLFFEKVDWSIHTNKTLNEFGLPIDLELPHNRNHLTFEFVGICLTAPGKVRYQIKLEGFDEHWSPVSNATYATYPNLPAGEYAFKVKACNNEGLWNKEPAVYRFRIKPPLWQTWWFYLTGFLALIISLYGYIKLRTRTLKKQKRVLEEQVHSRTLELEQEKAKVEQFNRELEQRVEERTRKLAIVNEKLLHAQKMEAIGTLAGGVAHDLNNILAGIVNYPELLLLDIPPNSSYRGKILAIQRSGLKAAAIAQDMLTLARRGVTVTEVVNLNRVISEFLQSPECQKIEGSNPGVRIENQLDKNLLNIVGSPVHLSKTLMNLVSNAVEAMPYGGKLIIKTKNQYLNPHHPVKGYNEVKEGNYVILMVSDTGIGMSENDMKHVFEPFYTKKKMGKSGTGLGMAVVWGTVQDHNGYITVQSSEGEGEKKGTTFTLYFPATHLSLGKGQSHLTMNELMGNGETILVVDDVEEQREAASMILKKLKYSVHTVDSGEKAFEYLKEQPTDLLVLDMIMEPGISGLETYKRVLKMYPRQKTIIVSGYTETKDIKEAQKLGAGTYVKKPYDLEKLGLAVKDELKKIRNSNIEIRNKFK